MLLAALDLPAPWQIPDALAAAWPDVPCRIRVPVGTTEGDRFACATSLVQADVIANNGPAPVDLPPWTPIGWTELSLTDANKPAAAPANQAAAPSLLSIDWKKWGAIAAIALVVLWAWRRLGR